MNPLKLVFSDSRYLVLSVTIFTGLVISLSFFSGFVFLQPYMVFYVPMEDLFSFSLLVMVSVLTGIVTPMSLYRVKMLRASSRKMSPGLVGSLIGAGAGACGCLSMNVTLLSVFGTLGGSALSFSTEYAIPLRLASIAILAGTLFMTMKNLNSECKIQLDAN